MGQKSLDETNFRLREARHRFANSLALLASLARRELREAKGREAREVLTYLAETIDIFHALNIAVGEDLEAGFDVRLTSMAKHWQKLCNGQIQIDAQVDSDLRADSKAAGDVLLIAQELILNAIKHAFPDGRTGKVTIELRRDGDRHAMLAVGDDGIGLSDVAPTDESRQQGRLLITHLACNIGATVSQATNGETGHMVTVRWPTPDLS